MSSDAEVLIVDDEERLRKTLMQMVQALGFSACGCATAEEAMRALQSPNPPRIVVLDLQLPVMHGLDLFQWIAHERPGTQVIVLTGFGDLESAQQAIRLGGADYLTKPCTMGELEQALGRARRQLRYDDADTEREPDLLVFPSSSAAAPGTLADVERRHILDTLHRNAGNRRATAAELGISLRTLYYRLAQYESD